MGDLSPHFSRWEFACPHCGGVQVESDLLVCLERLRAEVGRPLKIVSGWRCETYNRRVGGIVGSQHRVGRAADIVAGYATSDECRRAGFAGVGLRSGLVIHVDVQLGKRFYTFQDRPQPRR